MIPDLEHELEVTKHARKRTPKDTLERTALWDREKELERQLADARKHELEALQHEPPQTCLLCAHCSWDPGQSGYSEVTPGTEWCCTCSKNHFSMGGTYTSQLEYRGNLLRARTCPDFKLSQEAGDILRESGVMDSKKVAQDKRIAANANDVSAFLDDIEVVYRKHGMVLPFCDEYKIQRMTPNAPNALKWTIERLRNNLFCDSEPK